MANTKLTAERIANEQKQLGMATKLLMKAVSYLELNVAENPDGAETVQLLIDSIREIADTVDQMYGESHWLTPDDEDSEAIS